MSGGDYIAIDWGTTNRRAYLMRGDGSILDTVRDDRGAIRLSPEDYPGEIAAIRSRYGSLPVIAAGMIGSSRGWQEVAYCDAPAAIADLAGGIARCGDDVALVPGVAVRDQGCPDVMRGEEVQVLGALRFAGVSGPALFCQPGTHNKWITTQGDRIVAIRTAMTGELFELLRSRSILSEMLGGTVEDGASFRAGLDRGGRAPDLLTALFEARAAVLLGDRVAEETASYVSGLLIGADVASQVSEAGGEVLLLASGDLAELYTTAITRFGRVARLLDSTRAFSAGIHAVWEELQ